MITPAVSDVTVLPSVVFIKEPVIGTEVPSVLNFMPASVPKYQVKLD